jgi:fluoride ion exporter CrcB/FEX
MMEKRLLLVFVHGFKGGDTTFAGFPQDLTTVLSHSLPHLRVLHAVYPRFETRGDLGLCVAAFKEW